MNTKEPTNPTPELPEGVKPDFRIDSRDNANWLLRKLGNNRAERARVKAQADAILKSLDTEYERLYAYFEADLKCLTQTELDAEGKGKKTLRLLQGTLAFRSVPGGFKITDPDQALSHCLQQGVIHAVTHTPTLNKDSYLSFAKDALNQTGEILPGCGNVPDSESFSVRFPKDDV